MHSCIISVSIWPTLSENYRTSYVWYKITSISRSVFKHVTTILMFKPPRIYSGPFSPNRLFEVYVERGKHWFMLVEIIFLYTFWAPLGFWLLQISGFLRGAKNARFCDPGNSREILSSDAIFGNYLFFLVTKKMGQIVHFTVSVIRHFAMRSYFSPEINRKSDLKVKCHIV